MKLHSEPLKTEEPVTYEEHRKLFFSVFNDIKNKPSVIRVPLSKKDMEYAENFAKRVIEEKMKEEIHKRDGRNELFRWMTGVLGEVALGKFLKVNIHDDRIGESKNFTVPDLYEPLQLNAGVKTFRIGNFPLTNRLKRNGRTLPHAYPQVFICVDIRNQIAYILGVASTETLLQNESNPQNNRFVKDQTALKRKTAFTAFNNLTPFADLNSLRSLIHKMNTSKNT